jgi:hypothetical protein
MRLPRHLLWVFCASLGLLPAARSGAAPPPRTAQALLERHCFDCHDAEVKKGGLDLTALAFDLGDARTFATWVKIHDRVRDGEMPPKNKPQPEAAARAAFLAALARPMIAADDARAAREGRATWRRMNRYEYENTLRDLLGVPWLQVKDLLPEDGEAHRFNKVGDALDVSHVQMARYLGAAEYALREVIAAQAAPAPATRRYYARESSAFARRVQYSQFNRSPERATFPILGTEADVPALEGKAPMTVGTNDPVRRELESIGVVASTYEPLEIKFNEFEAPASGRYKLRLNAHTFWAGPESPERWWKPSRTNMTAGRTREPITLYAEIPPRLLRKLGSFDVTPEPAVHELEVHLLKGETIRPDAVRLFRSRPPGTWRNPLATPEGQPGVTFRWLEVEGPLPETSLTAGRQLLFGNLPVNATPEGRAEVLTANPSADAERLLKNFLTRACRRPVAAAEVKRFLRVIEAARHSGSSFAEAILAGYTAVLCSPAFVTLEERPGRLDDHALAARLSYFLWNSAPDAELRALADAGKLRRPEVLRAQTERLLADAKSQRFVEAFLDYWLDLRKANATSPDAVLYPDYYLDDFLVESAVDETRAFFTELIRGNRPARHLIQSDFAMINQRLAEHYQLWSPAGAPQPLVEGAALQRVSLPPDSPRGGLLTMASVLKVTANGTTTSPVLRGVWILERILGQPVPPPPAAVPAVEPDTRGATTIREQLDKHRTVESCNSCHARIDPAGFALESFDVLGGFRRNYRAVDEERDAAQQTPGPKGYGKNGQPFEFHDGPAVDSSGALPDGRRFRDVRELKQLLLADERQIARNLASQLIVFATGAPVRFGDRPELEDLLDRAAGAQYGVKALIHELVQSPLFQTK